MKVLLTATVQSHICQFHRPLVEVLHAHGCEVHVAARNNLAEKNGLKLDFADKVYDVPFSRSPKSPDNIRAYRELKKILDREHYDVVHCNTPMGGIVTRLAARKTRSAGTKVFYTAHGFHFYKGASRMNWLVFYPIERLFTRLTDKLITINREDHALAAEKFRTDVARIHGVGVNEGRYFPVSAQEQQLLRQELGFGPEQKLILCIGELLPNKNQAMAIRMMPRILEEFPDARLLLAGNGPEKENLEGLIAAMGLQSSVKLLGYCTCLEKYQRIADVLAACSNREGLPLNLVEAMLTENPVVATKNRGHCELVTPGETGFLVERNDAEAMGEHILHLLRAPEESRRMGRAGREFALQYGFENVKRELEQIYFGKVEK